MLLLSFVIYLLISALISLVSLTEDEAHGKRSLLWSFFWLPILLVTFTYLMVSDREKSIKV